MPIVPINGTTIAYDEAGSGEPILFIHGALISHKEWLPQIKQVSLGFRLILPDVRGHGESGRDGLPYSVKQWAEDMIALLDTLGVAQVVVCGHSMGGTIAQQMAADHPDRVCGLIIAESNYGFADAPMLKLVSGLSSTLMRLLGAKTAMKVATTTLGNDPAVRALVEAETHGHVANPASLYAILDAMNAYDGRANLTRIHCPTLVIAGQDNKITHKQSEQMAATISNVRLLYIPHSRHAVNWDNPEAFNEAVIGFMQEISP